MVGVNQQLNQRVVVDTRISTAWRWWRCGDSRILCEWLAEHVTFRLIEWSAEPPIPSFIILACSDHTGRPDKSGPMALNQFRPSVPVWSETLWQTFVKHVAISTWLILWIFTSYSYDK